MFKKAFASFLVFAFVCFSLSTFLVWFLFNSLKSFDYRDEDFLNSSADFLGNLLVVSLKGKEEIGLSENDYREVVAETLSVEKVEGVIDDFVNRTFVTPINARSWKIVLNYNELLYGEGGVFEGVAKKVYENLAICFDKKTEFGLYTCKAEDLKEEDFVKAVLVDLKQSDISVAFNDLVINFPVRVSGSLGAFLQSTINSFLLFSGVCLFVMLVGIVLLTFDSVGVVLGFLVVNFGLSFGFMLLFAVLFWHFADVFNLASGSEEFPLSFEQSQFVFQVLNLSLGNFARVVTPYLGALTGFFLIDFVVLKILKRKYDL